MIRCLSPLRKSYEHKIIVRVTGTFYFVRVTGTPLWGLLKEQE